MCVIGVLRTEHGVVSNVVVEHGLVAFDGLCGGGGAGPDVLFVRVVYGTLHTHLKQRQHE